MSVTLGHFRVLNPTEVTKNKDKTIKLITKPPNDHLQFSQYSTSLASGIGHTMHKIKIEELKTPTRKKRSNWKKSIRFLKSINRC